MTFAIDHFVARCSAAVREPDAPQQIAAILREAIADPEAIAAAVRDRQEGLSPPPMAEVFVNGEDLTIYHVAFPPHLFGVPHDHAGWAVIGVYKGAEEFNVYAEDDGKLVRVGRQLMQAPSVEILDPNLIHDIENSGTEPSGSIHVYSNRHFDLPRRRIWRNEEADAEPFTVDRSFTYGMERTNRIRRERGMEDAAMPARPRLDSTEDY
jgi:predicted metal-dependent enzyme (double-stranded beta helix superfamily)